MQEAPRCQNKHFWWINFLPDWNSQAAEWQNPPFTQHLLHLISLLFNYLLSSPYVCSLMFMQKNVQHLLFKSLFYLNVCNWKEGFVFPLDMTLICLDPSPGNSSVQITHVAILKYFDNLCLLRKWIYFHAAVPNFYCLELLFVRVYFCSKLVWGQTLLLLLRILHVRKF